MLRTLSAPEVSEESEHAWSLSFGDLMSLLLAVFVLIAAMSDLREGERFESVSRSVRAAFGFTVAETADTSTDHENVPPLLARFEAMGLAARKPMLAMDESDRFANCCSVHQEGERLIVRLIGAEIFDEYSATLQPKGERVVDWLAGYLRTGVLPVEIRGIHGAQSLPEHASYADGRDLAFARARRVADLLNARGIGDDRVVLSSYRADSPLQARGEDDVVPLVEIIVHAVPTASHENDIAGYLGS